MSVKGGDGVARTLRSIGLAISSADERRMRKKAMAPFVDAARDRLAANGSNKTRKLSRSLGVADKAKDTSAAGPISGKPHSTVGHMVELGTAPHWQPNRNGGQMHPGARPYPFMRPAFEQTKGEIMSELADQIVQAIEKPARGRR